MGHRTLVAYARDGPDRDAYDLHYAHWGVRPDAVTADTPFGGQRSDDWVRECAAAVLDPAGGHLTGDHETAVDPEPLATGLSFAGVCAHVDPLEHEALYVVDPDFSVRRYLVFGLRAGGDRRRTVLVGYDDGTDAAYLRGWLAGARAVRGVAGSDEVAGAGGPDPVVAALRWLDPARGTVVYPAVEPGV